MYLRVQKLLKAALKRHSKGRCLFPRTTRSMQTAFRESFFSFFSLIKYCSPIPYIQDQSNFLREFGKSSDVLWEEVSHFWLLGWTLGSAGGSGRSSRELCFLTEGPEGTVSSEDSGIVHPSSNPCGGEEEEGRRCHSHPEVLGACRVLGAGSGIWNTLNLRAETHSPPRPIWALLFRKH